MFLESSFFPFPSEVVMPPAGYLAWKGEMNVALVLGAGILGSILGALFNYWIAVRWGRPFFEKYGKYFFVTHESLDKAEVFFAHHGTSAPSPAACCPSYASTSRCPQLARMPLPQFCFYTALGSGVWVTILTLLGYFLGSNEALIHEELHKITILLIAGCAVLVVIYAIAYKRKKRGQK